MMVAKCCRILALDSTTNFLHRPLFRHHPSQLSATTVPHACRSDTIQRYRSTTTKDGQVLTYLEGKHSFRCFSTGSDKDITDGDDVEQTARMIALHEQLMRLGIDANQLSQAAIQSLEDPTMGPSAEFGISALRAYRSFVFPKSRIADQSKSSSSPEKQGSLLLAATASNCARQVEFLIKRHKSHQAEWVRHTDELTTTSQPRSAPCFPIVLLLDNVRSAFNVGSLFRTADACGCQLVVTTGITPYPFGNGADKLQKSALGAHLVVPSQHFATTALAVEWLRENYPQYALLGMETTEQSVLYTKLDYANYQKSGIVIVLGNEVTGVDTEIMPSLDLVIEIPMFGSKNSLNIAACAPVVLYEILRQWEYAGRQQSY